MARVELPDFILSAGVTAEKFGRWLEGRAVAHQKRDLKRAGKTGHQPPGLDVYRGAIHTAVIRCRGLDEYTGQPLDWAAVGTWDNGEAEEKGAPYKRLFRNMPTVDHVQGADGRPESLHDLRICSWEVNDAKGDLSFEQFEALCRRVLDVDADGWPVSEALDATGGLGLLSLRVERDVLFRREPCA